jgi:hypothetical protein
MTGWRVQTTLVQRPKHNIQKPMRQPRPWLMLTAVVVVVGLSSWLVTGGGGRLFPSSPTEHSSPSLLPRFPACGATEIKLTGAYDDCAEVNVALKPPCALSGANLMNTIPLQGATRSYFLYLNVDGSYVGRHTYALKPWPNPYFETNDKATKVAVLEEVSGALWQSTDGTLTLSGTNGRSGSVSADLELVGGEPTPGVESLHMVGQWRCG